MTDASGVDLLGRLCRRPVVGVFLLALSLRVVVAVVLTAMTDGVIAPDEAIFRYLAATVAADGSLEETGYEPTLRVTRFYVGLLAAGYRLFGPQLIVGRLLAAVLGAGAAAATTALGRTVLRDRYAVAAGAMVALLPSQVFFSSQTLKDALVWVLVATIAVAMAHASRHRKPVSLTGSLLAVAVALALLGMVRAQATAVAAIAVALAAWLQGRGVERVYRGVVAGAVAVVVPWLVGLGPLALGILRQVDQAAVIRARHAMAGETGFIAPGATVIEQILAGFRAYTVAPLPWDEVSRSWQTLARFETLLWYPVLGLALVGLWHARRWLQPLGFAILYAGGTTVVYTLASGDLMTAYRHRGEVVWVAALLAALRLQHSAQRSATSPDVAEAADLSQSGAGR